MTDDVDFSDFDQGVNPKEIFTDKNYMAKGVITSKDPVSIGGSLAIQQCNPSDLKHDFIEIFMKNYMLLTGSVDGKKLDKYIEGAGDRIKAEDKKTTIRVDGQK